jgi:Family of unknown function (DUF6011)
MGKVQFKTIVIPEETPAPVVPVEAPIPTVVIDTTATDRTTPLNMPVNIDLSGVKTPVVGGILPGINSRFLFAGKATFVCENAKGDHFTYRVSSVENEWPRGSGKKQTTYFLNVKAPGGKRWPNGSQSPWRYIGILNTNGTIKLTGKSEFKNGDQLYSVAVWAITQVLEGNLLPDGYKIRHAGKCGRCNRELTDPTSISRGIGPDCWEIMGF